MGRVITALALTALATVGLVGCSSASHRLYDAAVECNVKYIGESVSLSVTDDKTLLDLACVLVETDAPQAVAVRMDNTRAIDGTQEYSYGGITVTWQYHPDTGLNVLFDSARR